MPESPYLNRVRTRAMHRTLAFLRDKYRAEYEARLAIEIVRAKTEADTHTAKVKREHSGEGPPKKPAGSPGAPFRHLPPIPPRLLPGTRSEPVLRDDVARCPYCARFHARGHACAACGYKPAGVPTPPQARTG